MSAVTRLLSTLSLAKGIYSIIDMDSKKEITDNNYENTQYICLCTEEINKSLIGDKDPVPQENIGDLILSAFKSRPDFIGQVDAETEEQITFQQMRENSIKCALWLKKVGVKKGDIVTICTRNSSVVYMPFLASIYIGAIVNPWDKKYFKDMIQVMHFLVVNKPDIIFVDNDNFVMLTAVASLVNIKKKMKIVSIGEIEPIIRLITINPLINIYTSLETIQNNDFDKTEIDEFSCEQNDAMDIAIRTFSSAAVKYPGQADVPYIAFTSPSNKQTPVMLPGDVGLWYGSLCWTHGPLLTVHAILSNVTAIKSVEFNEENLYKTIEKHKVTWVFLESDTCNQLYNMDDNIFRKYDISSLRTLLFDNWAMRFYTKEKFISLLPDVSIIHVYSKPECGVISYDQNKNVILKCAGYVAKNVQLLFIRSEKNSVLQLDPRITGFVCCKTPYMRRCNKHETEQLWCYVGDKGLYKEDGYIFVYTTAREHYNIICKGNIFIPDNIEDWIKVHPAVSEVVVAPVRRRNNNQLAAYVKINPGNKVTKEELIKHTGRMYPKFTKFCEGMHFITNEIPRLPNGKVDRDRFHHKFNLK